MRVTSYCSDALPDRLVFVVLPVNAVAGLPVPVGVVGKLGWIPGPASVVARLWKTSSWSAVQRRPPMKRNRSVTFAVA